MRLNYLQQNVVQNFGKFVKAWICHGRRWPRGTGKSFVLNNVQLSNLIADWSADIVGHGFKVIRYASAVIADWL